jgi:hypothetical protein
MSGREMIALTDPANPSGIVWIASYPKSGNTWVRVFLQNFMLIANGQPLDDTDLSQTAQVAAAENALVKIFEQHMGKPLAKASLLDVATARPKVHETIKAKSTGIALIKTHNMLGLVSGTPTINRAVSAGAIYIVRNPLDVVLSLQDHLGSTLEEAILGMGYPNFATMNEPRKVSELWGSWSQNVESWTLQKADPILVLRYEDMLEKPVEAFAAIVHHLRQPVVKEQIEAAVERASFKRLKEQEERFGFAEKTPKGSAFFRVGKAGQWKEKLSEEQVSKIVRKHHRQMRRFGYMTPELERFAKETATA